MMVQTISRDREYIVASETKAGVFYRVVVNGQYITCDCLGNYHCGHCKHADLIRAKMVADEERAIRLAERERADLERINREHAARRAALTMLAGGNLGTAA